MGTNYDSGPKTWLALKGTLSAASPGSNSPGEREKPQGAWANRDGHQGTLTIDTHMDRDTDTNNVISDIVNHKTDTDHDSNTNNDANNDNNTGLVDYSSESVTTPESLPSLIAEPRRAGGQDGEGGQAGAGAGAEAGGRDPGR